MAWDGKNPWYGKKNPVTLVRTVVARTTAVQPSSGFAASSPNITMNPEKIPIKLNRMCTKVNGVNPKIMVASSLSVCRHVVARVSEAGVFLAAGKQTLASEEASYKIRYRS